MFNEMVTGTRGLLRDKGALEGALMRPQMAAHYEDANVVTQAMYLVDGICMAHAFVDGNKRTALVAGVAFLRSNGLTLQIINNDFGREIEMLVVGRDTDSFKEWIQKNMHNAQSSLSIPVIAAQVIKDHQADLEYLKDR